MILEILCNVFVLQRDLRLSAVTVTTDSGEYQIDGDGYSRLTDSRPIGDPVLPKEFRKKQIVEVRCDGEDIAIRLEDGTYISLGWQMDTRSGEGYLDVLFHGIDDIDADFLEFYRQLEPCEEREAE